MGGAREWTLGDDHPRFITFKGYDQFHNLLLLSVIPGAPSTRQADSICLVAQSHGNGPGHKPPLSALAFPGGSSPFASYDLKLRHFSHAGNVPAGEIRVDIPQVLLKLFYGPALSYVVGIVLKIPQPHILILPVNISNHFHGRIVRLYASDYNLLIYRDNWGQSAEEDMPAEKKALVEKRKAELLAP